VEFPRLRRTPADESRTEPPFDPSSWSGALLVMVGVAALLWAIEIVDQVGNHHWDYRFGLKPRQVDGLWGVLTQPFLHGSYSHLFSNTVPLVGVGWVLLLSGVRVWLFVTAFVVIVGGLATWLVAPSGVIVGASALVFGWMGYLLARAYFSRRLKWIVTAVALLIFFGTLLGNLLPTVDAHVSWQSHLCGFLAGVLGGWLLHPRRPARSAGSRAVS
jgi:membrane associated rhomboid family serine protease